MSAKPAKGVSRATRRPRDHNGQRLAYIYFKDELGLAVGGPQLTKDEARRIAANIAKLPEFYRSCFKNKKRDKMVRLAEKTPTSLYASMWQSLIRGMPNEAR